MRPITYQHALVAAIVDGYSRERYLDSAPWILEALDRLIKQEQLQVQVEVFQMTDERFAMNLLGFGPDIVWPMSLGAFSEDGKLQGFIETLLPGTPYVGSGVSASALGMDKEYTQELCQALGLAVPKSVSYTSLFHVHGRSCRVSKPGDAAFLTQDGQPHYEALSDELGTPLVVKPLRSGASLDLALVRTAQEFERAFANASWYGPTLVQEYIPGDEFSVCILETHPRLPICQIRPQSVYDTTSKVSGEADCIPARIGDELEDRLQASARAVHDHLGCHGFSRLDVKVDSDGRLVFLEINTNPGLIRGKSIYPRVCAVAGLTYEEMVRKIFSTALLPRRREVPRLSKEQAAPFPAEFIPLLPDLRAELQTPVYQMLMEGRQSGELVTTPLRHSC